MQKGRPKNLNLARCLDDFPYYAANVLKIKDKNSNLVPLNLWEPQMRLHNVLEGLKRENKLQRVIIVKARQEGISTYSEARIFHSAHLGENTKNVVIAHEKESGNSIFGMCRLFYDCLPKPLRPMTRYSSKRELVFENPDPKTRYLNPGLRSSLEVYTSGKKSVARGTTIHNLHCSELASWAFPDDVIPALLPTIPKNNQSLVVYESTAKGVSNFFHAEWLRAVEGVSNFVPFFLAWFDLADYRREFNTEEQKAQFKEVLNDEEKELIVLHGLSLEQLYWRRLTIADLKGDVELFRQEYPSTAQEAFIVSGVPVFDRRKLRMMALKCKKPMFRGTVQHNTIVPEERGEFRVWKQPEPGGLYVMGVDVADGGEGGDYSCIEVFKKLPAPYIAEQVAEWHGHLDPYNFAHIVARVGKLYGEALASVETNAHGLATQQELQRHYWNIYQQEHFDRYKNQFQNKIGWETTVKTKKLLISFGTHCIADMTILVHSEDLVRECMTFIRDETGSAAASGGGYDDRVMATLIALFTMHHKIDEEPLDSPVFQSSAPPVSKEIDVNKGMFIDTEFAHILEYGRQDNYEQSWLNY
uniref:Putative terminase n=1 Tax=viral metagenome TaxID=1070528 RepID=A0A6M3ILY5_9ZZZZ